MQKAMKSTGFLRPNLEINNPPSSPATRLTEILTVPSMNPLSWRVSPGPPSGEIGPHKEGGFDDDEAFSAAEQKDEGAHAPASFTVCP